MVISLYSMHNSINVLNQQTNRSIVRHVAESGRGESPSNRAVNVHATKSFDRTMGARIGHWA